MQDGKPGRGSDQFALRLPDGMREQIKAAAAANHRSMNAEIIARLEDTFPTATDILHSEVQLDDEEREKMNEIMRSFTNLLSGRRPRNADQGK